MYEWNFSQLEIKIGAVYEENRIKSKSITFVMGEKHGDWFDLNNIEWK